MRTALRVSLVAGGLALLLGVAGCNLFGGSGAPAEIRITVVGADQVGDIATVTRGRSYQILASAYDSSGSRLSKYRNFVDYTWSSTANSVASVDTANEEVDAKATGSCTIIATLKDATSVSGTITVNVL